MKDLTDLLRDIHNMYDGLMHELQGLQLEIVTLQKENERLLNEIHERTKDIP